MCRFLRKAWEVQRFPHYANSFVTLIWLFALGF